MEMKKESEAKCDQKRYDQASLNAAVSACSASIFSPSVAVTAGVC